MNPKGRFRGCLLGLAVGDAVGTTLEFKSPGLFTPINDMIGGGPFQLKAGEWTDDSDGSLFRCWKEGYVSSNGRCFDNTVYDASRHL